MTRIFAFLAPFVFLATGAFGQGKTASDSLTQLQLIPAAGTNAVAMPPGKVCSSSMQGNFYMLRGLKVADVVSWYAAHLSGFKKAEGTESKRAQIAFYNAAGTILVIVTGDPDSTPTSGGAYSVAYERYTPGIAEKTAVSFTTGHMVCK